MNIANGPVRPTPANLHPKLDYCIQMTLPNDREWIGAFFDAIYQLTYWFAWQRDEDHTGKDIAATWLWVLSTLRACDTAPNLDGCCDGGELLYRQNPDNPCLLESSADGIHWCTLFDVSKCTPAPAQPGSGAEQPPAGGGCVSYHGSILANAQWYLPTVVNAGDTLTFENTDGSATDAYHHVWYCPNGQIFFAGRCISTPFTQEGDILPTANHMTLVAQIDGTWYPTDTTITVPVGVSAKSVLVQVNDGDLTDNSGGYGFDVKVCNNGAATWSHDLNFALSPQGFIVYPDTVDCTGDEQGLWTAGSGWVTAHCTNPGANSTRIEIERLFDTCHITALSIGLNSSLGANGAAGTLQAILQYMDVSNVWQDVASLANPSGDGLTLGDLAMSVDAKRVFIGLYVDYEVPPTAGGGSGLVYTLHVAGSGPDPFADL